MTRSHAFLVVLSCLFLSPRLHASGFQLNEHSARGIGMGGAYVARPFDGSAMFVNPAGLAFVNGLEFYGGATAIAPEVRFRGRYPENPVSEVRMNSQLFLPPHAYLSYRITEEIAVGLGAFTIFGLGTDWPKGWAGRAIAEKAELSTLNLSATAAAQVTDFLAVGVGFNYIPGSVEITRTAKTPFSDPNGNPVEPRAKVSATGSGMGWSAGVLLKISEELTLAASYRSNVTMKFKGEATFEEVPASLKSSFPDGPVKTDLKGPANAIIGLAYAIDEGLTVETDFQYTTWSAFDTLIVEFEKPINGETRIRSTREYHNAFLLRLGIEYEMSDVWTLRAGYIFDKNPIKDGYLEPSLPDTDRHDLTLGVGYKVSEVLSIDASYMFVLALQRTETQSIAEYSFNGTYNSVAHLASLSIRYRIF
ncbi:MAG TPA: OmpP1/FadL family transporter [Bacteroidota bacterium]|nr:OmpP1/FadL family transporter [Bacteroidota bacterium]